MKKNIFIILSLISFISCAIIKREKESSVRFKEIKEIALSELPEFVNKIPSGAEQLYGFSSRDEINKVSVGEPFVFFVINDGNIKKTDTYRLPVILENDYKALITVESANGAYHIVDFGANILANEIQLVQDSNIEKEFEGILRIFNLNCDFVVMSEKNDFFYFPLTSAKMYLSRRGIEPANYYKQDQIINLIKH